MGGRLEDGRKARRWAEGLKGAVENLKDITAAIAIGHEDTKTQRFAESSKAKTIADMLFHWGAIQGCRLKPGY